MSISIKAMIKRWKRKRGVKNTDGAVLIEFALLAIPFFAIVGAIIETSLLLLASQILDAAVDTASRKIRTGQAQANSYTMSTFRTAVCDNTYGLFDCSNLRIFVAPISDFSSAALGSSVIDMSDGSWDATEAYNHGASSTVVLAQVYYKWPTFLEFFQFDLASLPDKTHLISGARLFQNEPF